MSKPMVVVGAGLAAGKAVEQLRASGFAGPVVVYGDEPHPPYERPPLSKGYLLGNEPLSEAMVHDEDWYARHDVDLRQGASVTGLDLRSGLVRTVAGEQPYDRLLLATGAAPRRFGMADASGAPVTYLRTIEDSDLLRQRFAERARIVVVGGGWIGLEVAAAARGAGCDVTVLEALRMPLLRVLGPEVARVFAALHTEHGVDLRTGVRPTAVSGDGGRAVVSLDDGSRVEADLVVVGVGVVPHTGVAEEAGLATGDGVLVDEHLRTSDPVVFAAGDVANAYHPRLGRRLRVEHWENAIEQGRLAARNMLGEDAIYDRMPYFYTDQYDLGMEYVGNIGPEGYDDVVLRGDVEGRVFTAFWLRRGEVVAGMHVNDWDAVDQVRALVGTRADPSRLLPA